MSIEARVPDIYKNIPAEVSPASSGALNKLNTIKEDVHKADNRDPYEPIQIVFQEPTPQPEPFVDKREFSLDSAGIRVVKFNGKTLTPNQLEQELKESLKTECDSTIDGNEVITVCGEKLPKKVQEANPKMEKIIKKAINKNNLKSPDFNSTKVQYFLGGLGSFLTISILFKAISKTRKLWNQNHPEEEKLKRIKAEKPKKMSLKERVNRGPVDRNKTKVDFDWNERPNKRG